MNHKKKPQPGMHPKALFFDAIHDLRRTWLQLLATDILTRVALVALLTPVVSLLLRFS